MTTTSQPHTLLVVDPCSDTQALIVTQVQGRGFSVIAAPTAAAALAAVDLTAPDIVITDLFLPDGEGLALTRELRTRRETCPIIVMAQEAPEPAVMRAFRAGAVDYLRKPVSEQELASALQRAREHMPADVCHMSGISRSEHGVIMEAHPAHIPGVVLWLVRTTASTLPAVQRMHVRGALYELLLNAVEHGCLEMNSQGKRDALMAGRYEELLQRQLSRPELRARQIVVQTFYDQDARSLAFRITDGGQGFQWRHFLDHAADVCRPEETNGRGIFLARSLFPSLTYNDRGNEVTITVPLA